MPKILISIGANSQRATQMRRARKRIREVFPDADFTKSIVTTAYEMPAGAPPYSNMLATFHTEIEEVTLTNMLKDLERELGDTAGLRKSGTVLMDIDLLQYGEEKRKLGDWQRQYVKRLLRYLILALLLLTPLCNADAQRDNDKMLLGKAIEYYQGRKYHECILAFEKLRRHYQLNPRFTAFLGFSYYKEQQYDDAAHYLTEGIPHLGGYSPKEQATYIYACAESLFHLGKYNESLSYYANALPFTEGCDAADIHFHMAFANYLQDNVKTSDKDSLLQEAYNHFSVSNGLYREAATRELLDELHTARLSQTAHMLRAMQRQFPLKPDTMPSRPEESLPPTESIDER